MSGKTIINILIFMGIVTFFLWWGNRMTYIPDLGSLRTTLSEDGEFGLTTDTWAIFNLETGKIIEGNNVDVVKPIASITKLFTAYAVMKSEKADTPVVIGWDDLYTEGRSGKLVWGETITPRELLFPLLIESSNDAGTAIRRRLGSDYDAAIKSITKDLSLKNTLIVDGSGLNAENVSTATELARIYAFISKSEPHIIDITRLQMYIGDETGWINNNPARGFEEFIGGKHGYTYEAGRTLVAGFRLEDGYAFGLVLLGSADLQGDIKSILADVKRNKK